MLIGIDASRAFSKKRTGTENYSYNLIGALAKIDRKNKYRLYVREEANGASGTGEGLELPENFEICQIPWPRLWTQVGLAWECFWRPPDVLFVPAHTLPIIRRPNLKTVVTIHDLGAEYLPGYHKFPNKIYLNKTTEYVVKHATRLIAVSCSTKKDLVEKLGADAESISVIYEGYNKNLFKPIKNDVLNNTLDTYDIKRPYFLFVGTIQPRKNLVRLIEALNILIFQYPNISLVLVGKRGWLVEDIYQAPKRLGIELNVRFLDYVPDKDLPAFYSSAQALVLPSLYEGFGLPILEAMACGCPVITSNTSSLPEVAGKAAILVNTTKVEEISKAMSDLLQNRDRRKRLIQQGFLQVKKFSWEKCARETLKVFEKVYEG